jgi:hypothetical protein
MSTDPITELYGPVPPLDLADVQWRIDGKPYGEDPPKARFVPYVDARYCAATLDRWVGPANWRPSYVYDVMINGVTVVECTIEIWCGPERGWVGKPDVGQNGGDAQTKTKGSVSDALKRAATVWGVGRMVYDLPGDIWAQVKPAGNTVRPHPGSVQQIIAELKKRGHEITRVDANMQQLEPKVLGTEGHVDADSDTTGEDREPITAEEAQALVDLFATIEDSTLRGQAKTAWVKEWGTPAKLPAKDHDRARHAARTLVADANETPVSDDAPREPDIAEAPASTASPEVPTHPATSEDEATADPSPPGGSPIAAGQEASILDRLDTMTNRDLIPLLDKFELATTGKMDEKRARLREHLTNGPAEPTAAPAADAGDEMAAWEAGRVVTHHPVTGEELASASAYVQALEVLEEKMGDGVNEFYGWLTENRYAHDNDRKWSQHDSYLAWCEANRIVQMQTPEET